MTSRERLAATLAHKQPDRVCVDFGATWISGIHTSIVHQLKHRLVGPAATPARVHEPYQMLAAAQGAGRGCDRRLAAQESLRL